MSRTRKQPYTKSKRFDKTCRCHGGCPYCTGNRLIRVQKEQERTSLPLAEEEAIDSSSDLREFHYPEKDAFLERHYEVPDWE